jgi:hypothetical protein
VDTTLVWATLIAIGLFVALRSFRRQRAITIKAPTIGFCDLSNGECRAEIDADRETIGPLFNLTLSNDGTPPICNVLFLYCRIGADGSVSNSTLGLRELIRDSQATVVVVASENDGQHYIAAAKKKDYGTANLVMTMNRKGAVFGEFFNKLFDLMKKGRPMPLAWVTLAPQIPNLEHSQCPEAIFACEAGQVSFL